MMLLNCDVGEDSWESLRTSRRASCSVLKEIGLEFHWKDWSWSSNTLATWCQQLTHWKRPWYWERLKAGGEGDNGGWDGWMASPTQWTWVWVDSGSWWWTGRPGVLQFMGSQGVGHNWATELNYFSLFLYNLFGCVYFTHEYFNYLCIIDIDAFSSVFFIR